MGELGDLFLAAIPIYGAWALGLATLVSALGVPLPATMLLLAAGALAQQGVLSWQAALLLTAAGAVLGDGISYLLARLGIELVPAHLQVAKVWQRAHAVFVRWGGLAVFLTRFALTPLALPTNLLAGSTRYAARRYLALATAGESLWVLLYGGIGYLSAGYWQTLGGLY